MPEGYFDDFSKKMVEMLPEKPVVEEKKPTVWLRIRPWAYMAAMFGGVWCMMYLFSDLKSRSSMEYNEQIAEAMSDEKIRRRLHELWQYRQLRHFGADV